MKSIVFAVAVLGLMSSAVLAAPPTAEQKADFYKTCYGISQNETLCTCKAEAALKLIDAEFMAIVIASMKGKALDQKYYDAYNTYVGKSNQVCKPNY